MDRVHPEQVREQQETRAPDVCSICRTEAPEAQDGEQGVQDHAQVHSSSLATRCLRRTAHERGAKHVKLPVDGRDGRSSTDQQEHVSSHGSGRDCHERDPGSHAPHLHGEERGLSSLSLEASEGLRSQVFAERTMLSDTVDTDFDFQANSNEVPFHRQIQRLVNKFQAKLNEAMSRSRKQVMKAPTLDLLEVMCSPQSEMVTQAKSLGSKAQRFGRDEGDLQTIDGRRKLFDVVCRQDPKHIW